MRGICTKELEKWPTSATAKNATEVRWGLEQALFIEKSSPQVFLHLYNPCPSRMGLPSSVRTLCFKASSFACCRSWWRRRIEGSMGNKEASNSLTDKLEQLIVLSNWNAEEILRTVGVRRAPSCLSLVLNFEVNLHGGRLGFWSEIDSVLKVL